MEPSCTEPGGHASPYQMVNPNPGKGAEGHFERTRPIGSTMKWIRLDPTFQLRAKLVQVPLVGGQQVGLGQDHQVLMTIQFPNDFVIAGARRIQEGDAPEIDQTGLDTAPVIAPPLDLRPGINHGSEDWKPMGSNFGGEGCHFSRKTAPLQRLGAFARIGKRQGRLEIAVHPRGWG